jgi:hypothetical protein
MSMEITKAREVIDKLDEELKDQDQMLAQYNFLDDVTRESAILKDSKVSKST